MAKGELPKQTSTYEQLPVEAAYLSWKRGSWDAEPSRESDPAKFFGGWRAWVKNKEGENAPITNLSIVKRRTNKGELIEVYAGRVVNFIPLVSRVRYEFFTEQEDKSKKLTAWASEHIKGSGARPKYQLFGVHYQHEKGNFVHPLPCVLVLEGWSAFLDFTSKDPLGRLAYANAMKRLGLGEDTFVIRTYGAVKPEPVIKTLGTDGSYTPVQSAGHDKLTGDSPRIVRDVTEVQKLIELQNGAEAWGECKVWHNSAGKLHPAEVVSDELAEAAPPIGAAPEDEYPF